LEHLISFFASFDEGVISNVGNALMMSSTPEVIQIGRRVRSNALPTDMKIV